MSSAPFIRKALVVDLDFLYPILLTNKTWLLRPRPTTVRGRVGLIAKGNCLVVGVASIIDCTRLLPSEVVSATQQLHGISHGDQRMAKFAACRCAWILSDVTRLRYPVDYEHRRGWSTWVDIDAGVAAEIQLQVDRGERPP